MNIHFIDQFGAHHELSVPLDYPATLKVLRSTLPSYIGDIDKALSAVINEQVITDLEFIIQKHHEVWFVPKATFDIKSWRASKAGEK